MLNQNSVLSVLTDDQKKAVVEMSRNDEDAVIGTKIGALHGQYDADIFGITGVKKKDGEKSYEYAKRVLNDYKAKIASTDAIQSELTAAKAHVTELQAKLGKGAGDETLRQQLKDAKASISQLQARLQARETEYAAEKAKLESAVKDAHVDYAFKAAVSGLKFKSGITEAIQKVLLNSAKAEILAKGTPDFVDDGQGGKTLVLRGADGNILNNPKTNLKPYTMSELVLETSLKDVIDTGRQQSGGGTGNPAGSGSSHSLDMSGVRTQVEADRAIESYLLSTGLTRDSKEFAEQSWQLRTENNVSELPIR